MRTRVWVLACTALLLACGDIQDATPDAGPQPDAVAAPDAAPPGPCEAGGDPTADEGYQCMTEAGCSLISRCLPLVTADACVEMDIKLFDVRAYFHRALVREAVEEGVIEYHPEEVAGCYATVGEMSCAEFLERQGFDEISLERLCPAVFTGTVAADGTCHTVLECEEPGSFCNFSTDCTPDDFCCPGTCAAPSAVTGSCSATVPCELGAYCVDGTCFAGDDGAVCGNTQHCDPGLWCNGGLCAEQVESGGPCTFLEQCTEPETCLVPPGAKSGNCARVDQEAAPCNDSCYGFVCVQPDAAQLGTCVPLLDEEGADCSDFSCNFGFECPQATDQCDPKGELGDPCSDQEGEHCKGSGEGIGSGGLFCDNAISGELTGQCSLPLPDSEPCTRDPQCQSGVCMGAPDLGTCLAYPGCYE